MDERKDGSCVQNSPNSGTVPLFTVIICMSRHTLKFSYPFLPLTDHPLQPFPLSVTNCLNADGYVVIPLHRSILCCKIRRVCLIVVLAKCGLAACGS